MTRKQTVNTFSEGLVMDLNPISTPNNVLTNALNATYITYNGNEYVLQNDMGNGRVETAYLPQGFVPLGTTSFGGIIYIVSYNPLINKCQIGCFPSPERNFSNFNSGTDVSPLLSDANFFNKTEVIATSIKTKLSNIKLSPGDKYVVYGDNIDSNKAVLSDYGINRTIGSEPKMLSLRLATIDNNGKISYIDSDLNWTKHDASQYYINNGVSENYGKDLESTRKVDLSPYNVFTSKVTGDIYLMASLEVIDTFDVTYDIETSVNTVSTPTSVTYKPIFTCNVTAQNQKDISGVIVKQLDANGVIKQLEEGDYNFDPNTKKITLTSNSFSGLNSFTFIPLMNFSTSETKELTYLSKTINIDFSLFGSNTAYLYLWRYYNYDSYLSLNWGLQTYYNPAKVTSIVFNFTDLLNNTKTSQTIENQTSYNGSFITNFNYGLKVAKDRVYKVDIDIYIGPSIIKTFSKIIYTTSIFNGTYLTNSDIKDFGTLKLDDYLDYTLETNITYNNELSTSVEYPSTSTKLSEWTQKKSDGTLNLETLGFTTYNFNNKDKYNSSLNYELKFKNNFNNLFSVKNVTYKTSQKDAVISTPNSSNLGTLDSKTLLNQINNTLSFEFNTEVVADNKVTIPFDLNGTYKNPIWASMSKSNVTYTNLIAPLIYNDDTASTFSFNMTTDTDGKCKIDTTKIICIGVNMTEHTRTDWWISYGELSGGQSIMLKESRGDYDTTNLRLGSNQFYDSIITTYANSYFNNSPIIPFCFIQTYNGDSWGIFDKASGSTYGSTQLGFEFGLKWQDRTNVKHDFGSYLSYGLLIKNTSGSYIPIRMISQGSNLDTYTLSETDAYKITPYQYSNDATPSNLKLSINRKVYEILSQLYKVYTNINYKNANTYIYDQKSYFNTFDLNCSRIVKVKPTVVEFNPFSSKITTKGITDLNNITLSAKTFSEQEITLNFKTSIKQNLLDYYLQDQSVQNYLLRTGDGICYIPKDLSYSNNNLYYLKADSATRDKATFTNDLQLLSGTSYVNFRDNFRRLLQIEYINGTAEHKCTFSNLRYWGDFQKLPNNMTLQNVLKLVNGTLVANTNEVTVPLYINDSKFYQMQYGDLIGNMSANTVRTGHDNG